MKLFNILHLRISAWKNYNRKEKFSQIYADVIRRFTLMIFQNILYLRMFAWKKF